jgi:hypothetical protein
MGREGKEDGPSSTEGVGQKRNRMPKFKKGDKVRVRRDCASSYRGPIGVIENEPSKDSHGFWYMVKFEWQGLQAVNRFIEEDLEAVSG